MNGSDDIDFRLLSKQQHHAATTSSATEISLQKCINKLADIHCQRIGFNIRYGSKTGTPISNQKNRLKQKVYDVLFSRYKLDSKCNSMEWKLVSHFMPDVSLSFQALKFYINTSKKETKCDKHLDALVKQILEGENNCYSSALYVVLLLAHSAQRQQPELKIDLFKNLQQHKSKAINVPLTAKQPLQNRNNQPRSLSKGGQMHIEMLGNEVELYNSLLHSNSLSSNASFGLPTLFPTQELNLTQFVYSRQTRSRSIDEGCYTGSLNVSLDETSDSSGYSSGDFQLEDDEPYFGYRKPKYDIKVWEETQKTKRYNYYSWEIVSSSNQLIKPALYVTEAGSEVYDAIWQFRAKVVQKLTSTLHKRSATQALVPVRPKNLVVDETTLLLHVRLVSAGVASETFHFNSMANMFLPRKNIMLSGVTSSSLRMLLMNFAKWGTAYWRLLQFSSIRYQSKSVIFKAFCEGIRYYLYEYQRFLLLNANDVTTLLQRFFKFHRLGLQICYMCQLCHCGNPSNAFTLNQDHFPTGVDILSYIYDEALFCTESSEHLVLLYLLQKCCIPYLKFVQNWVFHGMCWDLTGDFMMQVNVTNATRKDRLRWSNYIVPLKIEDGESTVPSFLHPVAQSLFICGKTLELMHLINPEHFLCTYSLDVPRLIVTYSQQHLEKNGQLWYNFQRDMRNLELQRTVSWLENEEKKIEEKQSVATAARAVHDQEMKERENEAKNVLIQTRRNKEAELLRLKSEAEEDAKKREAEKMLEKSEGNLTDIDANEKGLQLNKAKDELISHYHQLYEEVDRRKRKADWKIKRFALEEKRRKFFASEKIYFADKDSMNLAELAKIESFRDGYSLSEDSKAAAISQSSDPVSEQRSPLFMASMQNITDLGAEIIPMQRKRVNGQHVSLESSPTTSKPGSGPEHQLVQKKQVGGRNVSEESPSITGDTLSDLEIESRATLRKQVIGQHVSNQSSKAMDAASEFTAIRKKPVSGHHVSRTSEPSGETKLVSEVGSIRRKQVAGRHVSQASLAIYGEESLEGDAAVNSVLKKQVSGQHVSNESSAVTTKGSLRLGSESAVKNQVTGRHVSKESFPTLTSEIDCICRKPVTGQHVSQSTFSLRSDLGFIDVTHNNEVKIQPGLQASKEETSKSMQNSVKNFQVSQSIVSSVFDQVEPIKGDSEQIMKTDDKRLFKESHPRHVSESTVQHLMYYEKTSTPLKPPGACDVSSSESNMPHSVITLDDNVISKNIMNELHGSVIAQESSHYDVYNDKDDNGNPIYHQLPCTGTYDLFVEMAKERLDFSNRKNAMERLDRINLLPFYQTESDDENDALEIYEDLSLIDLHSLPNLLGNCIVQPIRWHARLVNRCVVNYFMMNLDLPRHFKTLRRFLLLEDGEFGSALSRKLFQLVHSGRTPPEVLNPLNLDSILDHSLQASHESLLQHSNLSFAVKTLPVAFSTSNLQALDCLELCYYVKWPCNIVITHGSHIKYNQVLSFLLQLNYVFWALHDIRIHLNLLASRPHSTTLKRSDLQKLQIYRHEMHNFVKVMQGYVSTQVLHVCWQEFWDDLRDNVNNLDDLHDRHVDYLNKCIMRCLLTKKAQNVMNVIRDVLKSILRFHSQLSAAVSLSLLNKSYQEFTRLSNFLYKVVSKLVKRGYQPHLEDFLTRLNFNEFYKD